MRKLTLTLLAVLIPLVAASLALGGYLNYAGVRSNYLELVGGRMDTVARRIAQDAEVALSVGVPLASQDVMNITLGRETAADTMILSADIRGADGRVLFSSDPERRGAADRPDTPIALRHSAPINTAFGTTEGEVVVRASRQALDQRLSELASGILWMAITAIVVAVAIVAAAVVVSVQVLWRRLTDRETTASGALVPAEMTPSIHAIDGRHGSVAALLGGGRDGGREGGEGGRNAAV